MVHDLFSGEVSSVAYQDHITSEEIVVALNDDTEIDDILN
jgi:hypothetical protein